MKKRVVAILVILWILAVLSYLIPGPVPSCGEVYIYTPPFHKLVTPNIACIASDSFTIPSLVHYIVVDLSILGTILGVLILLSTSQKNVSSENQNVQRMSRFFLWIELFLFLGSWGALFYLATCRDTVVCRSLGKDFFSSLFLFFLITTVCYFVAQFTSLVKHKKSVAVLQPFLFTLFMLIALSVVLVIILHVVNPYIISSNLT